MWPEKETRNFAAWSPEIVHTSKMPVSVRWLIRQDMAEVCRIERAGFADPWTEAEILEALRFRDCIGMVAENAGKVVGFVIYENHKSDLSVIDLAVAKEYRRCGVGKAITDKLRGKTTEKRWRIRADVCETNKQGLAFFKSQGYRAVAVRRKVFEDGTDAIRMCYAAEGQWDTN